MRISPQGYTTLLAKRLHATATLLESVLWCAVLMRDRDALDSLIDESIQTAAHLRTSPIVPDLDAEKQLRLFRSLQAALRKPSPDWKRVHHLAQKLAALNHVELGRLPAGRLRTIYAGASLPASVVIDTSTTKSSRPTARKRKKS